MDEFLKWLWHGWLSGEAKDIWHNVYFYIAVINGVLLWRADGRYRKIKAFFDDALARR